MDEATRADFTAFAGARWSGLVRTAVLLGCTRHEAEDLAQATLLRSLLKWKHVRRADDPAAYVARILVNLHRQGRRRRWTGERPVGELPERAVPGADVEVAETVRGALAMLTREQREVVVLRIHLQLSEAETARALGIPVGTAKSRFARALARLAEDPGILELHRGGDR